jgi:hypothetical protein
LLFPKVFDYDFALRDDFIGEATISLAQLELDVQTDLVLTLVETGKFEYLGQISVGLRLVPKSTTESPTPSATGECQINYSLSQNLSSVLVSHPTITFSDWIRTLMIQWKPLDLITDNVISQLM